MSKASNIQKLLDYLRSHKRATREELAQYLNVNKKTITSYINDVNADYHHFIKSETGKYGGYELEEYDTAISIDVSEIQALQIANEVIKKTRPEISPELNFLTEKIKQIYQMQTKDDFVQINNYYKASCGISVDISEERKKEAKIKKAINEKKSILIQYGDVHKNKKERQIDPYDIINFKGSNYVAGFCHLRNEFRIFKLSRIVGIKYTDLTFCRKENYNIKQIMEKTLGIHIGEIIDIKLKIDSPFDVIVSEKNWVKNQKITELDEKSIILEGSVSDDDETITWLLNLKDCVEILEPKELKEKYLKVVEKIYKKFF